MERKRLSLADLNPPAVVLANTYFWNSGDSANIRRRNEKRNLFQVYFWLMLLNKHFGLGMTLKYNSIEGTIEGTIVDENGNEETIAHFHYEESCRHVYKKQDFRKLLMLIKSKI